MSVDIVVRFTDEQAAALKAERARTLVPTSAFIRRAVEDALNPTGADALLKNIQEKVEGFV
jgi:hypothetical protein